MVGRTDSSKFLILALSSNQSLSQRPPRAVSLEQKMLLSPKSLVSGTKVKHQILAGTGGRDQIYIFFIISWLNTYLPMDFLHSKPGEERTVCKRKWWEVRSGMEVWRMKSWARTQNLWAPRMLGMQVSARVRVEQNSESVLCKSVHFFALVVFQFQVFCFALGYLVKSLFKKFQPCLK